MRAACVYESAAVKRYARVSEFRRCSAVRRGRRKGVVGNAARVRVCGDARHGRMCARARRRVLAQRQRGARACVVRRACQCGASRRSQMRGTGSAIEIGSVYRSTRAGMAARGQHLLSCSKWSSSRMFSSVLPNCPWALNGRLGGRRRWCCGGERGLLGGVSGRECEEI